MLSVAFFIIFLHYILTEYNYKTVFLGKNVGHERNRKITSTLVGRSFPLGCATLQPVRVGISGRIWGGDCGGEPEPTLFLSVQRLSWM